MEIKKDDIVLWRPVNEKRKVGRVINFDGEQLDILICPTMALMKVTKDTVVVMGNAHDSKFIEDVFKVFNSSWVQLQKQIEQIQIPEEEKEELKKVIRRIDIYDDVLKLVDKDDCKQLDN